MNEPSHPIDDPAQPATGPAVIYRLRLYISGATPRSLRAVRNIKMIGDLYMAGRYDLEVIDVYQKGGLVQGKDIVALPTLIKYDPPPVRRVIGDLSETVRVLRGLGITAT